MLAAATAAAAGKSVTFDASASTDLDGEIVSYSWSQVSGTPVSLNGADSSQLQFNMPADGSGVTLSLKIDDNAGASSTTQVNVASASVTIDNSGGGPALWLILWLVSVAGAIKLCQGALPHRRSQ